MVTFSADVSSTEANITTVPVGRYLKISEIIFTDTSGSTNTLTLKDTISYYFDDNTLNETSTSYTRLIANASANSTRHIQLDKPIKIIGTLSAVGSGNGKLILIGEYE